MSVRQVILSTKWVPLKLTTCHLPAIAILAASSRAVVTYQPINALWIVCKENAKDSPRYRIAATPRVNITSNNGSRVVRYFQAKYVVEPYWKSRISLLAIKIKDSCWRVAHWVWPSPSSNSGPETASPIMTPKWHKWAMRSKTLSVGNRTSYRVTWPVVGVSGRIKAVWWILHHVNHSIQRKPM
jgi:hypothetical protein